MEISSTREYPMFLFDITRFPILLYFFGLFFFDEEFRFIGYLFVFYMVLSQLTYRFTTRVNLEGGHLRIEYRQFFFRRVKVIGLKGMVMTMQDYQDVIIKGTDRWKKYLLNVMVNGKQVYRMDTREGYTKEVFLELMKAVGRAPVLE
ncbi:hypothetical protein [Chitinophaga silvisoli]|uniref:Uncharacterized protein n=1 Tax=Chitinophaga silvisoli TaxID=2291814 RepID=A0A3E1NZY5_9BACT|nr:hypothetical protein [Chitinophaga silvisoli]RFM33489.1 hypothetical protein DXN04_16135 [Chitinophaga silvisoli]